jgi:hypothetical protein
VVLKLRVLDSGTAGYDVLELDALRQRIADFERCHYDCLLYVSMEQKEDLQL